DQRARPAHLVHDLVASIDTQRALDAFELRAVANVDAGRADRHALTAIDAVAPALPHLPGFMRSSLLAAPGAIGDEQRIVVDHAALDARPRAHIDADLLAGDAAEQIGG